MARKKTLLEKIFPPSERIALLMDIIADSGKIRVGNYEYQIGDHKGDNVAITIHKTRTDSCSIKVGPIEHIHLIRVIEHQIIKNIGIQSGSVES